MYIRLENQSDVPIYVQIYEQIKQQILAQVLHEGDALPSIRQLARDLRISVITTSRAYDELEKDHYILTVPKKGCYVAAVNTELFKEEQLKQIEALIEKATFLAKRINLSRTHLKELIDLYLQEEN